MLKRINGPVFAALVLFCHAQAQAEGDPKLKGTTPHVIVAPTELEKEPSETLTITGRFQYSEPIRTRKLVVKDATIVCLKDRPLQIDAGLIEWRGQVVFKCVGTNGTNGTDGESWAGRGWCKGMDVKNAWNDYINGGNEQGGNGTNGTNGTDGSSVQIRAAIHDFGPSTALTFDTRRGVGGAGGAKGIGRSKCAAPSGDDCDHGTRLHSCRKAPDGVPGLAGADGRDGSVVLTGDAQGAMPTIEVNGSDTSNLVTVAKR
ncbi:hypothetical protein ACLESO_25565 [Pyxidicoccus sp. 3LG]